MYRHARFVARLVSALSAAAGGMTLIYAPTAHAAAGPLPPSFEIRNDFFDKCAYPQSDAPHTLRMDPCDTTDLSERWMYDPITQQVTNGRDATLGLCLTGSAISGSGAVAMTTCDSSSSAQRWELYEYDGAQFMAQADGSGRVLTARAPGGDWQLASWLGDPTQQMTFPTL